MGKAEQEGLLGYIKSVPVLWAGELTWLSRACLFLLKEGDDDSAGCFLADK
jgi:hypothetical protein